MKQNSPPARAEIRRSKPRSLTLFKSANSLPALITSLLLALGLGCQAQSWQTVDDFKQNTNTSSIGDCIVAGGPSNLVFAMGRAAWVTGSSLAVRRSRDQGKTWETVDDSTTWSSERFENLHAAISPTGPVVVAGMIRPGPNSYGRWFVRLSSDGGSTWAMVDDFAYQPDSSGTPVAVDIAPDGTIYVAGYATTYQGSGRLLIRRSADQGVSWETAMDEERSSLGMTAVFSVKLTHAGMFLTGVGRDMDSQGNYSNSKWRVLRSTDQMASWQIVDDWLSPGSYECSAQNMVEDSHGNLVTVGFRLIQFPSSRRDWVTRRSTDGGDTWATVDEINSASEEYQMARGVTTDSFGKIFVCGYGSTSSVRVSYDAGSTCTTSDRFAGGYSGVGIAADSAGNIYVIGGSYHWLVRKLAAFGPPLSIVKSGSSLLLNWPTNATGFLLQSATTLTNGGDWQDSLLSATESNGEKVVLLTPTGARGFFRLRGP